jgi:hypothetical protein
MQATSRRERILSMAIRMRRGVACVVLCARLGALAGAGPPPVPAPDAASVIRQIDAAVEARHQHVLEFTDIEHYAVFRGKDQTHPVAEMTVKDTYRKDVGKTYTVLSQSGSEMVLRLGLKPLLENERIINQPANLPRSWFTSANYEMKPKGAERIDGRDCLAIEVKAKYKASNTIDGEIWVDAHDYSLAQIQGVASKSPSAFAGTTHMMREYAQVNGFSMATHARADSSSMIFGHTVVVIDYTDYHLQLGPSR